MYMAKGTQVALPGFSRLEVPEQALGGIPLGLGLVVKMNLHVVSLKFRNFWLMIAYMCISTNLYATLTEKIVRATSFALGTTDCFTTSHQLAWVCHRLGQ